MGKFKLWPVRIVPPITFLCSQECQPTPQNSNRAPSRRDSGGRPGRQSLIMIKIRIWWSDWTRWFDSTKKEGSLRAATTPLPQWADIHKALFAVSGNCRDQQSKKKRHKNNAVNNINYFSRKNCDDIKTLKVWKLLFVDRGSRWR